MEEARGALVEALLAQDGRDAGAVEAGVAAAVGAVPERECAIRFEGA